MPERAAHSPSQPVPMRVRLADPCWRLLKSRALLRKSAPGPYADMIFRYVLHERMGVQPLARMDDPDEEIYVDLQISSGTRQRVAELSENERWNLASFGGLLLGAFFRRHERDPRDLAMLHFLTSRLDRTDLLSEQDVKDAISLCARNTGVRLPPGYFARWLHSRLQPLTGKFERNGTTVDVTLQVVQELVDGAEQL